MEEMLDELITTIKNESVYTKFKQSESELSKEELLLQEYRRVLDEYQELKKYSQHIDLSETRNKLKVIQDKMNQSLIIQNYYQSYHHLNDFLTEITTLIFNDISEELSTSQYKLG